MSEWQSYHITGTLWGWYRGQTGDSDVVDLDLVVRGLSPDDAAERARRIACQGYDGAMWRLGSPKVKQEGSK